MPLPRYGCPACIIHQIRSSMKYVGSRDLKDFLKDLKLVHVTSRKKKTGIELDPLEQKWRETYPIVLRSWHDKWDNLSRYFQYNADIRKIVYTTNIVEGYHRQVRKVTKNKGVFPNDDALYKLVYLT